MTWKEIVSRFKANGGSAYDPWPTFAHHFYHAFGALSALLFGLYIGIDWYWVFYTVLFVPAIAEMTQYITQVGTKQDMWSFLRDCILDTIEYWFALPFAWVKEAPMLFAGLFIVWWVIYLNLLVRWVKPVEER